MKTLFIVSALIVAAFSQECRDYDEQCPLYARFGYCRATNNMLATCPKSCGSCDPTPTGSPTKGQCGMSSAQDTKIIAGEEAKKDMWPWQVSIYYNGQFICGGSILSPNWVLTAAHCVDGFDYRNYQIVLGDFNRKDVDHDEQVYRATQAFHHPRWMSPSQLNNDVALIELDRPAIFNSHVQPICLPPRGYQIPVGTRCYITGWGQYTIGQKGPVKTVLQQSPLDVVSNTDCYNMNTINLGITVTDNMVCAGFGPGYPNSGCHGDSGGPFVCQDNDGRWVLQGSVSWGSGICDSRQAYSVFARISKFRDWIDANIY